MTELKKGDLVRTTSPTNVTRGHIGVIIGVRKWAPCDWHVYILQEKRAFYYSSRELRKLST